MAEDNGGSSQPAKRGRWRKRKQCKALYEVTSGWATITDNCTRDRGHDGPHANAFTQRAWVERRIDLPVTYCWPYEDMTVDTTVEVKGLGHPLYRYKERTDG